MSRRLGSLAAAIVIVALLVVAAVALFTGPSQGVSRASTVEHRLRCPVCKSVSIAESPSTTAAAMRRDVEQQITAGRSNSQIIDYFRARYGEWVLLDPPLSGTTLLLWLLPVAGASAGAAILVVRIRRSHTRSAELTPTQREHVARAVERARPGIAVEDEL